MQLSYTELFHADTKGIILRTKLFLDKKDQSISPYTNNISIVVPSYSLSIEGLESLCKFNLQILNFNRLYTGSSKHNLHIYSANPNWSNPIKYFIYNILGEQLKVLYSIGFRLGFAATWAF